MTSGEGENATTYEMNKSFASALDNKAERTIDMLEGEGATYEAGSATYDQVDSVINDLEEMTIDFHGSNSAALDGDMNRFLNAAENQLVAIQGDALNGNGNTDDAMALIKSVESVMSQITGEQNHAEDSPGGTDGSTDGTDGTGEGGGADGNYELSDVSETLDQALNADTPTEKASLLQDAIGELIDALSGGGSGEVSDIGGSDTSPPDDTEVGDDTGGDTGGGTGGGGGETAPPAIETTAYSGDDLMGKVYAEGGGSITYDESDGGLGIGGGEDDEIDRGEKMIFDAGETVQGGTVTVEDLHGDSGSRGTINVMKDGEVVDTIKVNGDLDGTQTVSIDQEFDSLEFFVEGGEDDSFIGPLTTEGRSSFAISEVTVDKEGPGGATDGTGGTEGGSSGGSGDVDIPIETATLVEILQALSSLSTAVDGSAEADDTEQSALMDDIGAIMEQIVAALEDDATGEPTMTGAELSDLLSQLQTLVDDTATGLSGDTAASSAIDEIIAAIGTLVEDLEADQATS